jgi:protein-tyrosine phosphatase
LIDTHCHLLPAIDDGPSSEVDSIDFARRLWEQGVRRVVCTPHVSTAYEPPLQLVRDRLKHLARSLRLLEIRLEVVAAGELSGSFVLAAEPSALRAWRMGERHVLVEVSRSVRSSFFQVVTERLGETGLSPVFAHPERSLTVRRDPHVLDSVRPAGGLVQVVAPSLARSPGSDTYRTAWGLLESGRADIVASDAHRAVGALRLGGVLGMIEQRFGAEALRSLTVDAPERVAGAPQP